MYKGKVFYGQEPPSVESTTTISGVNYQLLAVMLLKIGSSQFQSTTDSSEQWRQRQQIQLSGHYPPPITRQYLLSATCTCKCVLQIQSVVRGFDPRTFGILGHRIAYAATQLVQCIVSTVYSV